MAKRAEFAHLYIGIYAGSNRWRVAVITFANCRATSAACRIEAAMF